MRRLKPCLKPAGVLLLLCLGAGVAFVWWWLPGRHYVANDTELPIRYAGDRFIAEPVTKEGVKLRLLTDTGGGLMLSPAAVTRCGLRPIKLFDMTLSRLPTWQPDAWIPEPTGAEKWLRVAPAGDADGLLGQRWFAGGVWTFDYPAKKLILRATPFALTPEMRQHSAPLGFRKAVFGFRDQNHPRITVHVAGEPVQALFDTGATVWLSPEAMRVMNTRGDAERGTCFVTASQFEQWHRLHPSWRVIERGCAKTGAALIEVPEVELAGLKAGPVWFTHRQEGNYAYVSRFMDKPIAAAIGGNFLKHFRVTVDYPGAVAYFERATD